MQKLKLADISQLQMNHLWSYSEVEKAITRFENVSTEKTFKFLFGDVDGERLWRAFRLSCNNKYYKFKNSLDSTQQDYLLIN